MQALSLHFKVLRQHVRSNGGYEVKTEGDAMFAVFPSAIAAVRAACAVQARPSGEHLTPHHPPLSAPSPTPLR